MGRHRKLKIVGLCSVVAILAVTGVVAAILNMNNYPYSDTIEMYNPFVNNRISNPNLEKYQAIVEFKNTKCEEQHLFLKKGLVMDALKSDITNINETLKTANRSKKIQSVLYVRNENMFFKFKAYYQNKFYVTTKTVNLSRYFSLMIPFVGSYTILHPHFDNGLASILNAFETIENDQVFNLKFSNKFMVNDSLLYQQEQYVSFDFTSELLIAQSEVSFEPYLKYYSAN